MEQSRSAGVAAMVAIEEGDHGVDDPQEMRQAVWRDLKRPLPRIDSKYFYDDHGSELFERITQLPEYYQTRTEEAMLEDLADRIIALTRPRELVELGSGAGRKIHLLLDAMRDRGLLEACVLLDVNESFLRTSAERLAFDYQEMRVRGVVGDFIHDLAAVGEGCDRLFIFFAGTVGNLHPVNVLPGFLDSVRTSLCDGDSFLVGVDLVKDAARLEAAYNDAAGVTAAFNRNILRVLNRRFGTDFDVDGFEHVAFWDPHNQWIEMRLRASRPSRVSVGIGRPALQFDTGDEIRTELSCKYTRDSFAAALAGSGLTLWRWYTDPEELFGLALVRRRPQDT